MALASLGKMRAHAAVNTLAWVQCAAVLPASVVIQTSRMFEPLVSRTAKRLRAVGSAAVVPPPVPVPTGMTLRTHDTP